MASRKPPQHGASANAGRATSKRSAPRRASAPGTRATTTRKAAARKLAAPRAPKQVRPTLPARAMPAIVVLGILLLGWYLYPVAKLQYVQQRELSRLERQYADVRKRNQLLRSEVDALKTPAGIEQAARENLNFAKKGEKVYVVIPEGTQISKAGSSTPVRTADMGAGDVWTQVLDAVFGVGR